MKNNLINLLKPGVIISIEGKKYKILQHIVWWQAKCNENYDKYVLEDESSNCDYRLFFSGDFIGMSKVFLHPFKEPMPKILYYKNKKYNLVQDEFCIVHKEEGKKFYKIGDAEIWWDYISSDKKGLSLGRNWETWEREDLETKEILPSDIKVLK